MIITRYYRYYVLWTVDFADEVEAPLTVLRSAKTPSHVPIPGRERIY